MGDNSAGQDIIQSIREELKKRFDYFYLSRITSSIISLPVPIYALQWREAT